MKKQWITLVILFNAIMPLIGQTTLNTHVDERTELVSIVCMLAEYKEYNENNSENKAYINEVNEYFEKYKSDSLVQYAKLLRQKQDIGYDAPMSFAINLEYKNGFQLISGLKNELPDERWTTESADNFLRLLNKFYVTTNFRQFFAQHQPFYTKMANNFDSCLTNLNLAWYEKFYGEQSKGSFTVILNGINGGNNYGTKNEYKNGMVNCSSIMGPWIFDSTLTIPKQYLDAVKETIIHEFNHSFCNPLVFKYLDQMESHSKKMFKCVKSVMEKQAYGLNRTMMCELLVRAGVIKYTMDNNPDDSIRYKISIVRESLNGFYWIDAVYKALQQYDKQRDKHPTLDSYMPEMVKMINSLETKKYIKEFESKLPKFKIQTSIKDGTKNVDPNTKELIVKFDRKMDDGAYGCTYGKKGRDYMPKVTGGEWNMDNKQEWVLAIQLEPNKEYSIAFPYEWFRDENMMSGKSGMYTLSFKTGNIR